MQAEKIYKEFEKAAKKQVATLQADVHVENLEHLTRQRGFITLRQHQDIACELSTLLQKVRQAASCVCKICLCRTSRLH